MGDNILHFAVERCSTPMAAALVDALPRADFDRLAAHKNVLGDTPLDCVGNADIRQLIVNRVAR